MFVKALFAFLGYACVMVTPVFADANTHQIESVRGIIAAVNSRDADAYVANFAEDVLIKLHDGEVRVNGRAAMRENRQRHFVRFPNVRNELLHLVSIDDKVIMHDRVWLEGVKGKSADIVEIFTFRESKIIKVDVIQPSDLFRPQSK